MPGVCLDMYIYIYLDGDLELCARNELLQLLGQLAARSEGVLAVADARQRVNLPHPTPSFNKHIYAMTTWFRSREKRQGDLTEDASGVRVCIVLNT
eukprot:1184007-Prorocentrum_minimum.AAC.3